MTILCETDRLIIRNWIPQADAAAAFEMYGDPEVMRFIRNGETVESLDAMPEQLQRWIDHYIGPNHQIGFWAVVETKTADVIGNALLTPLPDSNGVPTQNYHIGWQLKRAAWGKGYATEAARAVLDCGFNEFQLPTIYALVNPKNHASLRVAQRLGMIHLGRFNQYFSKEYEFFKLNADG
jgi:ribosomal-protein-alanine N-acetyltransferase